MPVAVFIDTIGGRVKDQVRINGPYSDDDDDNDKNFDNRDRDDEGHSLDNLEVDWDCTDIEYSWQWSQRKRFSNGHDDGDDYHIDNSDGGGGYIDVYNGDDGNDYNDFETLTVPAIAFIIIVTTMTMITVLRLVT